MGRIRRSAGRRVVGATASAAMVAGGLLLASAAPASAADCAGYGLQFATSTKAVNISCSRAQARHTRYSNGIVIFDGPWSSGTSTASGTIGTSAGGYYRLDTGVTTTAWFSV